MGATQATFRSADGKRLVLVVEDVEINREILGAILEDDYEVLFAEDGETALRLVEEHKRVLSLVLLDLVLPGMPGQEVLRRIKANAEYQDIPVIVASGVQSEEIECLNAGANDFIQKPYPEAGVVLARAHRAIELFEGRQIIQSTERDPLTGLYNREFFFSYAEKYDQHHPDVQMDAIVLDINHFSIINERHGRAYADEVLRRVGEKAREMVHDDGGIVCRREADIFFVYCPHREDYKAILDNASMGLTDEQESNNRVRLRMGVYSNVDRTLELDRRFDRAKNACDSVRDSFTRSIGIYDDTLHKAELYAERLIEDFCAAIEQKQFKVYFQPKFDISGKDPFLIAAEGLVRWQHPELGLISPGVFIPLFEGNGLIQDLDHYVWRETARQIRTWKDEIGGGAEVQFPCDRPGVSSGRRRVRSDHVKRGQFDARPRATQDRAGERDAAEADGRLATHVAQRGRGVRRSREPRRRHLQRRGYRTVSHEGSGPLRLLYLLDRASKTFCKEESHVYKARSNCIHVHDGCSRHAALWLLSSGRSESGQTRGQHDRDEAPAHTCHERPAWHDGSLGLRP